MMQHQQLQRQKRQHNFWTRINRVKIRLLFVIIGVDTDSELGDIASLDAKEVLVN